jgi:hypothetical protein
VVIEQDEDGGFMVEISISPGCFSQGKTRTEALKKYPRDCRRVIVDQLASLSKAFKQA